MTKPIIAKGNKTYSATAHPALQQRSREKRDRLIKAGMIIFAQKGYEQTRVVDLAKAANISVGVFYQRFEGKRGFFDALETNFVSRGKENWNIFFERLNPKLLEREFLEVLVSALGRVVSNNIGFFRALITIGHHDKDVIPRGQELDYYGAELLEQYLIKRKFVSKAKLRENQVYFGLSCIMKNLLVLALNDYLPDQRTSNQETVRELAAMLGSYLGMRLKPVKT